MRLYLLQLGLVSTLDGDIAMPGYLIQTDDGTNVLVDTGFPRSIRGRQEQAAAQLLQVFPDDPLMEFTATVVRNTREDEADLLVNRLAVLGLTPRDIDYLVCTHFDFDHTGSHDLFHDAQLIVQRSQFAVAHEHVRFQLFDSPWSTPGLHYRLVEGDTELLPGITLLESSGHVPGHQSLLVRLPETGPVLLAEDAIVEQSFLDPAAPEILQDMDPVAAHVSRRKLLTLAEGKGVKLIVFGHDAQQWPTLRKSPEFYT